jgi:cytochrome c oxidase cbb3-type subunit 3
MMTSRAFLLAASLLTVTTLAVKACGTREPPVDSQVIRPSGIMDFNLLYAKNCAGCHGPEGKGGAAISLADPVYLIIADDATIARIAANGVPGTSMPAFAQHAGGMLVDDQINVIVKGIRAWARPGALRNVDALRDAPPPYVAQNPGDPKRGAAAYGVYCASCHGAEGKGGKAGSIVDAAYLALVSDQNLRTTVIAGRPDMGAPDWRGNVPGKAMSPEEVSDVVSWLAALRPQGGNR